MKLVSDIINELMDLASPMSSALFKTKVLASRIQNETLQTWVNNELKGYEREANLPDYRKTEGFPKGNFMNGWMQYKNTPIPIGHLTR
ncbi:hypothetical protein H9N25_00755 [Pedobacter riviphilus]|uniref:AbiTii domain-containing protein n=1 Tax=Pedobacter riviphilus TaxID=2766984 RepID=A0ABX6THX9_9SPHI|nr:hypothetical protein H9N25_00755 [Pedobacter riviphilus]